MGTGGWIGILKMNMMWKLQSDTLQHCYRPTVNACSPRDITSQAGTKDHVPKLPVPKYIGLRVLALRGFFADIRYPFTGALIDGRWTDPGYSFDLQLHVSFAWWIVAE